MKLLNKILLFTCVLFASFVFSIDASAQCKRYVKKDCLPSLNPYLHNGQLTSKVLNPGGTVDVKLTFNGGKKYRILLCSEEELEGVQFIVLDKYRRMLYESDPKQKNPYWDFKVRNTQQFFVKIIVPPMKDDETESSIPKGCVSLMVGFKE